ncbi:dTMP kinase [Alicyclobacillus sp. SO9]|uniref:dTMP kinase n=1 Tax=Alicyclobacillus sp. SO9 TaxID=2665646 RepID=UPI0018E849B8|nr:dTMP kinase [Alicyclobacillus sp. SO9]QQE79382.1 dTMP kinase [Alicyclobacillus sp. SO9]
MFITFEGLDGAGKSTQIGRLKARLEAAGRTMVSTREPGGTPVGDSLRHILLNSEAEAVAPKTEALLYAASRAQLVAQVIEPALTAGKDVICDRYVDASLAYQGQGLELGEQGVAAINQFATGGLRADITFLFDVTVATSRERVENSRIGQPLDRIEQRDNAYFHRVRDEFLRLAKLEPDRIVVLDASNHPDDLEEEIWHHVEKRLPVNKII